MRYAEFTELKIKNAIRELLTGRVNEYLGRLRFQIPLIEFKETMGGDGVCPVLRLRTCERTEKERILRLDAYTVEIEFTANGEDGELFCYAYGAAVDWALKADSTLGGAAVRALITGKHYAEGKTAHNDERIITLRLRITV
jgi:hypothetical protein